MRLTNPIRNGNSVSLPLRLTYATNAKPSSGTTRDRENIVSLCSSRRNDIGKCGRNSTGTSLLEQRYISIVFEQSKQ